MGDLKRIKKLYEDAINFCKSKGKCQLDLEDKVYTNFLSAIYPIVSTHPYYCDDFVFTTVDRCIEVDCKKEEINEKRVEEILELICKHFEINKAKHYLLIPLQGAKLEEDIIFENFFFLKSKNEEELISQIAQISKIERKEINSFLEHTRKSRSPDFLEHAVLVVEMENQTSNIDYNAVNVAQGVFRILKLIHYAERFEDDFMLRHLSEWYQDNYHVAIVSSDSWRCGHRCWWKRMVCKIDVGFMQNPIYQTKFRNVFNEFVLKRRLDELEYKFYNALELFNKSLEQVENPNDDKMLSLLLLFSAAESLLTEGDNEKKLRLCVVWPRIISLDGYSTQQFANIIKKMYEQRNNFVHAGQVPKGLEDDDELLILQQMMAKLILKFFDLGSLLDYSDGIAPINAWKKYVKKIFEGAIFGYESEDICDVGAVEQNVERV